MSALVRTAALALLALAPTACGPMTEDAPPAADCAHEASAGAHAVDPFMELLVVDEAVLSDAASKNETSGALSFRHTLEQFDAAPDLALGLLDEWAPPPLTCAWLRDRAENGCDATCSACAERRVDLARAPFRLIAVANRIDLAEPTGEGSGEGRLLFAATEGPGDDPRSPALGITVIFEFRLEGDRAAWASAWHALGARERFDAEYIQALSGQVARFAVPAALAQVRVNDAVSTPHATMSELHYEPAADEPSHRFVRAGLRRTPAHVLDGSDTLRAYAEAHRDEILSDRYELSSAMLTDRVTLGQTWSLPGVDEPLRHAFASNTCDGCHGQEHPAADGGFHVSPFGTGVAKLSRFLFDPGDRAGDELTRRASVLQRFACAP